MDNASRRALELESRSVDTLSARPRDGDVVVTREPGPGPGPAITFSLRQLPAAAQSRTGGRDEALQFAREFGRKHGVDVWYRDGAHDRLIERCRKTLVTRVR